MKMLLFSVDNYAMDATKQHGFGYRKEYRLRQGQNVQPIYRRSGIGNTSKKTYLLNILKQKVKAPLSKITK